MQLKSSTTCTPCRDHPLECNQELIKLPWQACCVSTAATAKALLNRTDTLRGLAERTCTPAGSIQTQQREAVHDNDANVLQSTAPLAQMNMTNLMVRHCQILCGKLRQLSGLGLQHDVASVLLRSWLCAQQFWKPQMLPETWLLC